MDAASEWKDGIHEGYRTKVIKYKNATIEINRPILTPEEQARRTDDVKRALVAFFREKGE